MAAIVDLDLDRTVLKQVLFWLRDWVSKNRDTIKVEFGRASRYTPGFIDTYVVDRFVDGVAHLLEDAAENPDHQMWGELDRAIDELRLNMRTSAALREQIVTACEQRSPVSREAAWRVRCGLRSNATS